MRHLPTLILSLPLLVSFAVAKDLPPNTGKIKLNSNLNMQVFTGEGGCTIDYQWHYTYGGCRMRGADITDNEFAPCPDGQIGTRTRSRYREQWILQGSRQVAVSSWSSWQPWAESDCRPPSPPICEPQNCANRAHLHAYSMDEGQGGGESYTLVLAYVHCTLYRNNAVLIDRHVFINAVHAHKDSLQANHGVHACNQLVAEIQAWGIGASIDYASIDWNATMGWARVNYW